MNDIKSNLSEAIELDCLSNIKLEMNDSGLQIYGIMNKAEVPLKTDVPAADFIDLLQKIIVSLSSRRLPVIHHMDSDDVLLYDIVDLLGITTVFLVLPWYGTLTGFELTRGLSSDETINNIRGIQDKIHATGTKLMSPANDPVFQHDMEEIDRINKGDPNHSIMTFFVALGCLAMVIFVVGSFMQ